MSLLDAATWTDAKARKDMFASLKDEEIMKLSLTQLAEARAATEDVIKNEGPSYNAFSGYLWGNYCPTYAGEKLCNAGEILNALKKAIKRQEKLKKITVPSTGVIVAEIKQAKKEMKKEGVTPTTTRVARVAAAVINGKKPRSASKKSKSKSQKAKECKLRAAKKNKLTTRQNALKKNKTKTIVEYTEGGVKKQATVATGRKLMKQTRNAEKKSSKAKSQAKACSPARKMVGGKGKPARKPARKPTRKQRRDPKTGKFCAMK